MEKFWFHFWMQLINFTHFWIFFKKILVKIIWMRTHPQPADFNSNLKVVFWQSPSDSSRSWLHNRNHFVQSFVNRNSRKPQKPAASAVKRWAGLGISRDGIPTCLRKLDQGKRSSFLRTGGRILLHFDKRMDLWYFWKKTGDSDKQYYLCKRNR